MNISKRMKEIVYEHGALTAQYFDGSREYNSLNEIDVKAHTQILLAFRKCLPKEKRSRLEHGCKGFFCVKCYENGSNRYRKEIINTIEANIDGRGK
ncbi:hypothetical protein LCGC14_0667120 [marine sediment metagenome]|uniref:Uncharacterized protein n=1 Tax=marine sediment metagenome TaxID=412755 RepID=A0A0F9QRY7_9ZZZZ